MQSQEEFLAAYAEKFTPKFNPVLFKRDEDMLIYYLKHIVLGCERSRTYLIKVVGFRVVDDPDEIKQALIDFEREKFENKSIGSKVKKTFDASGFDKVEVRKSIYKLLLVRYYASIDYQAQYYTVPIKIPVIIDKYYMQLYGKMYLPNNQIIDASTYNNSNTNPNAKTKKKENISFRTIFMKTMMIRGYHNIKTVDKIPLRMTYYISNIFTKNVLSYKYLFAKFGFFESLDMLNMRDCIRITETDPQDPDMFTFCRSGKHIFISCPKMLFDQAPVQSMLYTVYKTLTSDDTFNKYHLRSFWLKSLGADFGNASVEKGIGILDSFENIYESIIRDGLHLPENKKRDMYDIICWMLGNYAELRQKNNMDISTKRIRWALYLACHYSAAIAEGLYRIADTRSKSADCTLDAIRKAIVTDPDILLKAFSRGNKLVISKNSVNANDAFDALTFSFKGLGGIGENNKAAINGAFRAVDVSHIDRVDVTHSSNNDPGMSGIICPMADIYGDSFSEYEEPKSFDDKFNELINQYRALKSKVACFKIKGFMDEEHYDPRDCELVEDTIKTVEAMIIPWRIATAEEREMWKR